MYYCPTFRLLEELVHAMHDTKLAQGREPHETIVQAAFSPSNNLQDNEATMNLLKNERVFAKVVDILGANIKVHLRGMFMYKWQQKQGKMKGCITDVFPGVGLPFALELHTWRCQPRGAGL